MGTNYYRIPTVSEIEERKNRLQSRIETMPITPDVIENNFGYIDNPDNEWGKLSPWDEFIEGTSIHLGKRSTGWKFCWNFHNNNHYSNKEELIKFVLSGRVVDEYGTELEPQEFLDMAFAWGEPDGLVANKEFFEKNERMIRMSNSSDYYDKIIDGLRVSSSTEFS